MQLDTFLAFSVLNSSLHLLVDLYEEKYRLEDKALAFPDNPDDFNLPVKETFDFVIVGGGTAGSLLANRLSESFTVLLLEAGGNPVPLESIPRLSQPLKWIPSVHHIYSSIPQKNANLRQGGIVRTSTGKFLGGSSSHNGGQYERGSPFDYDNWAKITNDSSWKYENVLKYFTKVENYNGEFQDNGQHGKGGPINVVSTNVTFRGDLFLSAGKELGFEVRDPNGPQKVGFGPAEYTRDDKGRRVSSYTAFIKPIENTRKTLTIRRYSVVSEIIFDGTVAVGVKYERHGIPSVAFSSKEIILSAGSYVTPLILIKSGIGPQDQLQAAKIPPVSILPVGQNFQDHVVVYLPLITVNDTSVFKSHPNGLRFEDINNYVKSGKGLLADAGLHEAFIASSRAEKQDGNAAWPDIQLYFGQSDDSSGLFCTVNINRPKSRGKLSLNTAAQTLADSLQPVIDYNFFSDQSDYDVALEGIEMCRRIVRNTTTFAAVGAIIPQELASECAGLLSVGEREHAQCSVGYLSDSNFHISGTAPMGTAEDPKAVVDSKLRVQGVANLRVCDASIMPTITNGNTMAPVLMIAEKTADEIIRAWK